MRCLRVVIDADVAARYGVTIKRPSEREIRYANRFTGDFMFVATPVDRLKTAARIRLQR